MMNLIYKSTNLICKMVIFVTILTTTDAMLQASHDEVVNEDCKLICDSIPSHNSESDNNFKFYEYDCHGCVCKSNSLQLGPCIPIDKTFLTKSRECTIKCKRLDSITNCNKPIFGFYYPEMNERTKKYTDYCLCYDSIKDVVSVEMKFTNIYTNEQVEELCISECKKKNENLIAYNNVMSFGQCYCFKRGTAHLTNYVRFRTFLKTAHDCSVSSTEADAGHDGSKLSNVHQDCHTQPCYAKSNNGLNFLKKESCKIECYCEMFCKTIPGQMGTYDPSCFGCRCVNVENYSTCGKYATDYRCYQFNKIEFTKSGKCTWQCRQTDDSAYLGVYYQNNEKSEHHCACFSKNRDINPKTIELPEKTPLLREKQCSDLFSQGGMMPFSYGYGKCDGYVMSNICSTTVLTEFDIVKLI